MKSREEYEASIFAKRDALLEKRKKITAAAVSAACIVLCFAAATVFLPKSLNKSSISTTATTSQSAVEDLVGMGGETGFFDAESEPEAEAAETAKNEEIEYFTQSSEYNKLLTTSKGAGNFGYNPKDFVEKETTVAAIATQTEIALEPEILGEDGYPEPSTSKAGSTTAASRYTTAEIAAAAYKFLTEDQKAKVTDPKTENVTVTHMASGEDYYEVFFETENGGYVVKLEADSLDFIETKILSSITAKISQAYNPAATTAAPGYIPE